MNVVVSQALATGLPVVATRHSGLAEQVADGVDGLLVPEGDPAALAEAIVRLATQPDLVTAFGARARGHVERSYDSRALIARQVDVYRALAGRPGGGSGGDERAEEANVGTARAEPGSRLGGLRSRMRRVGPVRRVLRPWWYRYRFGELGRLLHRSQSVPNFSEWDERIALYHAAASLPPDAVVLEIGCFLGATTIMLAGARRAAGSGVVHAVDPFDARGDAYSAPIYASIARGHPDSLRGRFEAGLRSAGVADLVVVHEATAETLAPHWDVAIDMLYLGGDQSVAGARRAFDLFEPHLKVGGVIALQNTREREYRPDHDGNHRLRKEAVVPPRFAGAFTVDNTTIARKVR